MIFYLQLIIKQKLKKENTMITFDNLIIPTLKILYEMNKEMSIKEIDKALIAYVGENTCNLS